MLNATFQFHPIKMGCCNTNKNSLIVTTINPIWHSCPVHHGTKFEVLDYFPSAPNLAFVIQFGDSN